MIIYKDQNYGTQLAVFSGVYNVAKKWKNRESSTAHELSTYERIHAGTRSNKPNERANAFRNFAVKDVVRKGANPTMTSRFKQQQLLENKAERCWMEIYDGRTSKK